MPNSKSNMASSRKPMGTGPESETTPQAPSGQPFSEPGQGPSVPHRTSVAHSSLLPPQMDHKGE